MSPADGTRKTRVAQAMRDVLAEMIDREVKDPRVKSAGLASVNHVELNADMSTARVYISFLGAGETDERRRDQAMVGLDAAAGFLRGPLARRLSLRRAPSLRFVHDDSPAFSQRIAELVRPSPSDDMSAAAAPESGDGAEADDGISAAPESDDGADDA